MIDSPVIGNEVDLPRLRDGRRMVAVDKVRQRWLCFEKVFTIKLQNFRDIDDFPSVIHLQMIRVSKKCLSLAIQTVHPD